jgi:hypothetical protein
MESERGWGRDYWQEVSTPYDEAKARIKAINSENTSLTAPDYYMQAEQTIRSYRG